MGLISDPAHKTCTDAQSPGLPKNPSPPTSRPATPPPQTLLLGLPLNLPGRLDAVRRPTGSLPPTPPLISQLSCTPCSLHPSSAALVLEAPPAIPCGTWTPSSPVTLSAQPHPWKPRRDETFALTASLNPAPPSEPPSNLRMHPCSVPRPPTPTSTGKQ